MLVIGIGVSTIGFAKAPANAQANLLNSLASPVTVERHIIVHGKRIDYEATTGLMEIRRDDGKIYQSISYTSYTAKARAGQLRPITFVWNGGPGGASIWLHMGALGPRRAAIPPRTFVGPAPYHLVDNDFTLLDQSDLVFIDEPGSGFSRPLNDGTIREVYNVDGDATAFTRFITRYLDRYERWNSPKFLFGESYGTTRAAVVAHMLQGRGVELNGVVLLSSALDLGALALNFDSSGKGPDRWYVGMLPTFAATGYELHRVSTDRSLSEWVEDAKTFAAGQYAMALQAGDRLDAKTRLMVAEKVAHFTGLTVDFVLRADLRVSGPQFRKELMRSEGKILGRFNASVVANDRDGSGAYPSFDPSSAATNGVYLSIYRDYLAKELNVHLDEPYYASVPEGKEEWGYEHSPAYSGSGDLPDMKTYSVIDDLGATVRQNPSLRIFIAGGLFDLATPVYIAQQNAEHLGLHDRYSQVVQFKEYASGHMLYEDATQLSLFRADLRLFYDTALAKREPD